MSEHQPVVNKNDMTYNGIALHVWQRALFAQSASNLSGVVRGYVTAIDAIRDSGISDTDAVNKHPIARLYAEQVSHLTGAGMGDDKTYRLALKAAQDAVNALTKPTCEWCGRPIGELRLAECGSESGASARFCQPACHLIAANYGRTGMLSAIVDELPISMPKDRMCNLCTHGTGGLCSAPNGGAHAILVAENATHSDAITKFAADMVAVGDLAMYCSEFTTTPNQEA